MSRIESGRIHLEESEVKLPEVLSELETITSGHVQAKQLKLSVDAGEIANETVCCDKTRLNQILLNLLSNAIKFTPVGGRILVRLRQLPGTQENKTVCGIAVYEFRVKDNGIGMSPEFIKKYSIHLNVSAPQRSAGFRAPVLVCQFQRISWK